MVRVFLSRPSRFWRCRSPAKRLAKLLLLMPRWQQLSRRDPSRDITRAQRAVALVMSEYGDLPESLDANTR